MLRSRWHQKLGRLVRWLRYMEKWLRTKSNERRRGGSHKRVLECVFLCCQGKRRTTEKRVSDVICIWPIKIVWAVMVRPCLGREPFFQDRLIGSIEWNVSVPGTLFFFLSAPGMLFRKSIHRWNICVAARNFPVVNGLKLLFYPVAHELQMEAVTHEFNFI
jgi:hypothetical protein